MAMLLILTITLLLIFVNSMTKLYVSLRFAAKLVVGEAVEDILQLWGNLPQGVTAGIRRYAAGASTGNASQQNLFPKTLGSRAIAQQTATFP